MRKHVGKPLLSLLLVLTLLFGMTLPAFANEEGTVDGGLPTVEKTTETGGVQKETPVEEGGESVEQSEKEKGEENTDVTPKGGSETGGQAEEENKETTDDEEKPADETSLMGMLTVQPAMEGEVFTDELGNKVQWWNFRNTQSNNAVTDRPTPTNDKEAWGKWAAKFGSGWAASPTPPVIVNDKLYIGVANQIVEVDKATGAELRRSETMPGNVGYAMNSPVYADGKIFMMITNGRIAAINLEDLSLAWVTDNSEIVKGQTVSPISYKKIDGKGYVYTGTWKNTGGDLVCATTDDENVTIDEKGNKIKALEWHFNPAIVDAENLAANNSVALGYYWTGAYVTEKYLAIGSDNGSTMGDTVNDTAYYTLDPKTGEIIDAVYGIKGQVRSTTVYANGNLYFSTKGAKIYKIPVTEEGDLGTPSYIDMGEFGATASTATPVVYGGKIYLGVSGKGSQFSADGGHGFVVARDDETLSQSSFVYNIPVPGYPQAGALLSTDHVDEDFDGDGAADQRVYLYFTYNAQPGGIFYTYDTPNQTAPTTLTVEEAKIFVPAPANQQYCISSIVVDTESNLYYKNDSGCIFAVESNPAILNNLQVYENDKQISLDEEFQSKMADHSCLVSPNAEKIKIVLDLAEGVTATVQDRAYTADGIEIALTEDVTTIPVVTQKGGKGRSYQLVVTKASAIANLAALGSAIKNTVPSATNTNSRTVTPALNKDIVEYSVDWISTGTGSTAKPVDPATETMMNLFLAPESDKATVQVFPGTNIDMDKTDVDEKGAVVPKTASSGGFTQRIPLYSANVKKDSTARIVVTAQDGVTTKEYNVTFTRRVLASAIDVSPETATIAIGEEVQLYTTFLPETATEKQVTYTSSKPETVSVSEDGVAKGLKNGSATITVSHEDGATATCEIVVGNVQTVDVDFTSQLTGAFLHAPAKDVEVASNTAELFGYTDSVNGVSALDVLVAAHKLVYGASFTPVTAASYLAIGSYGSPDMQFGIGSTTFYGGFFVNRAYPNDGTKSGTYYNGTTVTTHKVKDGDLVEFFFYEDENYGDTYNWFVDADGAYSRSLAFTAGETYDLTLKGFFTMSAGEYLNEAALVEAEAADAIAAAQIYLVDPATGALSPIKDAITDANGNVSLSFTDEGTYHIAAYGTEDTDFTQLLSITDILVKEGETIVTTQSTEDKAQATVDYVNPKDEEHVLDATPTEGTQASNITETTLSVPADYFEDLAGKQVTVETANAEVIFDEKATAAIFTGEEEVVLMITETKVEGMDGAIDISLSNDGFTEGNATVRIPLDLKENETVKVYYIHDGIKEEIPSAYDRENKVLIIHLKHFSVYAYEILKTDSAIVNTGDQNNRLFWILAMFCGLCGAGISVSFAMRKKNGKQR